VSSFTGRPKNTGICLKENKHHDTVLLAAVTLWALSSATKIRITNEQKINFPSIFLAGVRGGTVG
jgi:hypothetical protein